MEFALLFLSSWFYFVWSLGRRLVADMRMTRNHIVFFKFVSLVTVYSLVMETVALPYSSYDLSTKSKFTMFLLVGLPSLYLSTIAICFQSPRYALYPTLHFTLAKALWYTISVLLLHKVVPCVYKGECSWTQDFVSCQAFFVALAFLRMILQTVAIYHTEEFWAYYHADRLHIISGGARIGELVWQGGQWMELLVAHGNGR